MIGKPGNQITVGGLTLNMQVGVGLATGQGSAPEIMCRFSPDGGHTWDTEHLVSIGAMGNYHQKVRFDAFCTGYDVRCRVSCSDPVLLSIFDGVVDIEDAGY
jgi:hypothetical protein